MRPKLKNKDLANVIFIFNNETKVVSLEFKKTCAKLFFGNQYKLNRRMLHVVCLQS